jgi:hypothetical protein
MPEPLLLPLVALTIGIPIGIAFGATAWERKARQSPRSRLPFGQASVIAIALGGIANALLGLAVFLLPPYLVLDHLNLLPLRGQSQQAFFMSYLLSLGAGKLIRFCYWRWTYRGRLV